MLLVRLIREARRLGIIISLTNLECGRADNQRFQQMKSTNRCHFRSNSLDVDTETQNHLKPLKLYVLWMQIDTTPRQFDYRQGYHPEEYDLKRN